MRSDVDSFDSCVIFLVSSRWKNKLHTVSSYILIFVVSHATGSHETPPAWSHEPRAISYMYASDNLQWFSSWLCTRFSYRGFKGYQKQSCQNRAGNAHAFHCHPLSTILGRLEGLTAALFNVISEEWGTEGRKRRTCAGLKEVAEELRRLSNYCKTETWKTSDGQIKNKCYRWEQWNMSRLYPAHPCNLRGEAERDQWISEKSDKKLFLFMFRVSVEMQINVVK